MLGPYPVGFRKDLPPAILAACLHRKHSKLFVRVPTISILVFAGEQEVCRIPLLGGCFARIADPVGVMQTLTDFALNKSATDGFRMLIDRAMPELTGEAIVLRHRKHFTREVIKAAEERLETVGVDVNALAAE